MVYPELIGKYLTKWATEDATFDELQAAFPTYACMVAWGLYKN
jgi:hypothetical protein